MRSSDLGAPGAPGSGGPVSPVVHPRWPARLHVVTGKGGTGKTTVAAALALALASGGHRTLLVEVEGRQGIAQLFDTQPLPYEELHIAAAPGDGEVRALAVDAEEALLEYLDLFYKLGRAGRALRKFGAIDFATTIAPGMRDVLLTGKVKEATTRSVDGRRVYSAVVLDAPPTGRIARFLNVTAETARLAKLGPIKTQSEGVAAILRSPMTAVHVVTLLEEMPVQETSDAIADLTALGLPVRTIMINGGSLRVGAAADDPGAGVGPGAAVEPGAGVEPGREQGLLTRGSPTQAALRQGLAAAGLPTDRATVSGLHTEAKAYLTRREIEESLRAELAELGKPLIELPLLPDGVDRAGLNRLAAVLVAAMTRPQDRQAG